MKIVTSSYFLIDPGSEKTNHHLSMAASSHLLLEPLTPPSIPSSYHDSSINRQIRFRHPWYDDGHNILFSFFAPDNHDLLTGRGLYASFALDACGIVTNNRWDGWLSRNRTSSSADDVNSVDPHSVLDQRDYYYHLPKLPNETNHSQTLPYSVVPNFRQWSFPHDRLPNSWTCIPPPPPSTNAANQTFAPSNLTSVLKARDTSCRMTGYAEANLVTHLCPAKEDQWWRYNNMARYNSPSARFSSYNPSNTMLLRADLHHQFEARKFVFVPKQDVGSEYSRLVTHVLEVSPELEAVYHNHALQPFRASLELLFSRFAWSIFPYLEAFFNCGQPRRLCLANQTEASANADGILSPEECAKYTRGENHGNKKRKIDDQAQTDNPEQELDRGDTSFSINDTFSSPGSTALSQDSPPPSPSNPLSKAKHFPTPTAADESELAKTWLAQERLRSDPENRWSEDVAWARWVSQGDVVLSAEEAKRWMEIYGVEVQDE